MNKKLSIFAIVLIIVGLIGSVWSGFLSMPYFINKLQDYEEEINKEKVIYEENININNLSINTKYANIKILKNDSSKVIIKTNGLYKNSEIKINQRGKELVIEEEINNQKIEKIKNIDDLINIGLENTFSSYRNTILVYIPNNINISAITEGGNLDVKDNIFLDSLTFKTYGGSISLPSEIKNLKLLDLTSKSDLSLKLSELLGIDEVNINSNEVYISSKESTFYDMEKYIPKKVTINGDNLENGIIDIESTIPISKDLTIDSYKSEVLLNLPLDRYNFNFNVATYEGIEFNDYLLNLIKYRDESELIKEFKTILNPNLKDEYKININALNLDFR